jgi:hypothetical protein
VPGDPCGLAPEFDILDAGGPERDALAFSEQAGELSDEALEPATLEFVD